MPDMFGQETPQEALARVKAGFKQHELQQMERGVQNTPGGRAGLALGQIFGGIGKEAIDTWVDRRSEAQRLAADQGLSKDEARALAKKNVPWGSSEVRRAKQIQKVKSGAEEHVELLTAGGVNPVIAQASGMIMMSAELRKHGFAAEATEMTKRAMDMRNAEEERLMKLENLQARTDASKASAENADETTFTKLVNRREVLQAKIDQSDDPSAIYQMEREQGTIDAQIAKLNTITGTTPDDPSAIGRNTKNKLATEIIDDQVLLANLELLSDDLIAQKDDWAATKWGRMGARSIGIAEDFFGRKVTESDQEFIDRVKKTHGSMAFVSADIRHSLTGAAMSPAEAVFLEPFLPSPSDSRAEALAKTRVLIRYTKASLQIRQAILNGTPEERNAYMSNIKTEVSGQMEREKAAKTADEAKVYAGSPEGQALIEEAKRLSGVD